MRHPESILDIHSLHRFYQDLGVTFTTNEKRATTRKAKAVAAIADGDDPSALPDNTVMGQNHEWWVNVVPRHSFWRSLLLSMLSDREIYSCMEFCTQGSAGCGLGDGRLGGDR